MAAAESARRCAVPAPLPLANHLGTVSARARPLLSWTRSFGTASLRRSRRGGRSAASEHHPHTRLQDGRRYGQRWAALHRLHHGERAGRAKGPRGCGGAGHRRSGHPPHSLAVGTLPPLLRSRQASPYVPGVRLSRRQTRATARSGAVEVAEAGGARCEPGAPPIGLTQRAEAPGGARHGRAVPTSGRWSTPPQCRSRLLVRPCAHSPACLPLPLLSQSLVSHGDIRYQARRVGGHRCCCCCCSSGPCRRAATAAAGGPFSILFPFHSCRARSTPSTCPTPRSRSATVRSS